MSLESILLSDSRSDLINPREFWPAYPDIAMKVTELVGSEDIRNKIPIVPIEDFFRINCLKQVAVKKIQFPIVIGFDNNGRFPGILIAYKIKSISIPKCSCFNSVIKKDVELISIIQKTKGSKISINSEQASFGPGAAHPSEVFKCLQKFFNSEPTFRSKKHPALEYWSFYNPTQVMLDTE